MEQTYLEDVLDLKSLRCFWAMARVGSLTRAGIELGVSESAVSQRIKALEAHLKVKLYESPGGKVRLTSAGQRLMEMAIGLFDQVEQFQQELSGQEVTGELQLATQEPTLRYVLPPAVQRFTNEYPQVRLRILSQRVGETVDLVRQGQVDVGIISQTSLPDSLVFYPWRTYEAYLLLPVGHRLLRGGRPPFQELVNYSTVMRYPLIAPERGDPAYTRISQALEQLGLPFNVAFEVGTIETVKHYVELGLGLAVVSGICLTREDQGKLEAIEIPKEFGGTSTYGAVLRRDKHLSVPLQRFLALLDIREPSDAPAAR